MSALDDLIKEIPDAGLRDRISAEFGKLKAVKKFGLVFETQKPEVTPLYGLPIKVNSLVAEKLGRMNQIYRVQKIESEDVTCTKYIPTEEIFNFKLNNLVRVALFGEPIYPYLQKLDSICNAPDSDLWHTLIEADNYHALQMLQYVCKDRKVDCIYIDPPYNTGAKDWKYNNDYVDGADEYRHSKWLSMMQRRLKLAKQILNPADSVLVVTIDEKEYLHLGCLLEEIFPNAEIQMVSITNNPAGTGRTYEFARVNEFAFFIRLGEAKILPEFEYGLEHKSVSWDVFRRSELSNVRQRTRSQFYPIFVDVSTGKIKSVGDPLDLETDIASVTVPDGCIAVFPIRDDGIETSWSCKKEELLNRLSKGYIKVGKKSLNKPQKYSLSYIKTGAISDIEAGKAVIEGYNKDGSVQAFYKERRKKNPATVLIDERYNARTYGSGILDSIIGQRFSYPKSLYAVVDCLKFVVANKPDALIVDFFAGSGTTLHAVNLLNAEDGGKRRCILVTNNEVAESEEKILRKQGYQPNDEEWQKLGVARYVTWQRTVCSIKGENINGEPLQGNYLGSEIPMSDGFKSNAIFFKLGFLNKDAVALGRQFKEILPLIWLKAGSFGVCPKLDDKKNLPPMLILPENRLAVLLDEKFFMEFEEKVLNLSEIETVFIVTDSLDAYTKMIQNLRDRKTYQLYRDYLENFKINIAP